MQEQIKAEEMVTSILYGLTEILQGQEELNKAKAVLYRAFSTVQLYREETALSTQTDSTLGWVRSYLESMAVRGCTEKTVRAYQYQYRHFFGRIRKPVTEITTSDIRGYLSCCKLAQRNRDSTINNKIRMLRGLFTWLTEEEYLEKNPMLRIKDNKVEHRVKEVFEDEQLTIFKDAAKAHGLRSIALVDFLHRTGVRISEMVALNRADIDFAGRQCVVYGKGRKERPVYFDGETFVHLRDYLASRTDDNPALFVTLNKPYRRLTADGVRFLLNSIRRRDSRLEGVAVNPHKWRRQFVTELLEKDVPLTLVADLVGHANLNTTKDNYGNYSKNKAREAHRKYVG